MKKQGLLNTIQSYMFKSLSKIGLSNKKAVKLGLNRLKEDDVFVVSFPKSGNTWVRFILANMLEGKREITMQNINEYVPGIYNFRKGINLNKGRRYIKSHDPFFDCYPKTIYVYRDYRDVLVSYYYYLIGHSEFNGTSHDFVKSSHLETNFGTWGNHVSSALEYKKKYPNQILLIGFDELREQAEESVRKIAEFCEIVPKRSVPEIVERCSFDKLKIIEKKHGKVFKDSKVDFFRSGESGQWRTVFSQEDMDLVLREDIKNLMNELNLEL